MRPQLKDRYSIAMTPSLKGPTATVDDQIVTVAREKLRIVSLISAILIAVLIGNVLLMSTFAHVASMRLLGSVSFGIAYSVFVILAGAAATAFYSWWANRWADPATQRAAEKLLRPPRPMDSDDDAL